MEKQEWQQVSGNGVEGSLVVEVVECRQGGDILFCGLRRGMTCESRRRNKEQEQEAYHPSPIT